MPTSQRDRRALRILFALILTGCGLMLVGALLDR